MFFTFTFDKENFEVRVFPGTNLITIYLILNWNHQQSHKRDYCFRGIYRGGVRPRLPQACHRVPPLPLLGFFFCPGE